ncbi:MAG: capsule biosynthesis protein [Pseudomonas sp.]
MSATVSWLERCRALDRYRWLLLRERYGVLGSAVRFAREALSDWRFGLQAKRHLAGEVVAEPCDVLLLQNAPKVIAFARKKAFIQAVRERGHNLVETALQSPKAVCRQRLLQQPPQPVPLRYFGYAAYAQWLVSHHQPRVLLNDRNGSLYSPFLRLAMAATGRPLVHLAHASTVESSRRLGMNDYDYYLLFGRSSLEALQARSLRFGDSIAVLAGSHMIDSAYDLPPADGQLKRLLVLGVGPDKEKEPGYQRTYELLRDWAAANPAWQVLIKRHPRSAAGFWQAAAEQLTNVQLLAAECSLAEALGQATVVVNIMSNAVIEAGLAGRPVLYVNLSGDPDIFAQERFFGPRIESLASLQQGAAAIAADYAAHVATARAFALFHLSHGSQGLAQNVRVLEALLDGQALPADIECAPLNGTD